MSSNYVSGMKPPQSISEEVALEITTRREEEHTQGSVLEGLCLCVCMNEEKQKERQTKVSEVSIWFSAKNVNKGR